ncbi:MAG: cation transporter [Gluconacetobacter diazotrophicus]|nr:cation transporter [Gluconacetobacter diazotrophicus]
MPMSPPPHDHPDHDAHDHDHHDHDHGAPGHAHAPASFGRAFAIGIGLNGAFVIAEAVYGLLAHSLSLLADAGHNLGDVLGLAAAWLAAVLGRRRPSARFTYGLRRSSILAALGNAVVLILVTGGIAAEAIRRLLHPEPAAGLTILVVSAVGIAVNGATALLFMSGRKDDLNLRGAFLHMAGDALVAFGVVVAGALILLTGLPWLDPVASLLVSVAVLVGTWGLLRDSTGYALDAVPPNVDPDAVAAYLRSLPGVSELHDLHIWGMSTTETALTAHLVRPDAALDDALLRDARTTLRDRFRIAHATLQLEAGTLPCPFRPAEVV